MRLAQKQKNPAAKGLEINSSFLGCCDPRAKLGAFFLLMPLLLTQPLTTPGGWVALFFVSLALIGSNLDISHFFRQLKRLRWLFVALLVFHAVLTPGQPLWLGLPALSREGVIAGIVLSVRLILMVSLSLVLLRTTTHLQIVAGFRTLFGFLERLGVPLERGLALLAFTLGRIPQLVHEAGQVREDMAHRLGENPGKGWMGRMYRLALAGEALLFRLLRSAQGQEEALRARGISQGLPTIPALTGNLGWRDGVLLLSSGAAVIIGFQI
jgi:energy-coupling factor transport system permease protein